ncbi:hypothetical protein SUBVAR_05701 [Subdoligranulum variabile DSM 15176]|uniref:Uncharacterized protein n=1 Tax=Subdoligranulum variabile DSM 15176 TaxID=411471 RepID=D1PMY6_9FIRM|nr:hypothetical protein SUBVAR_05701 [Subdoligranulum variabile DSM 15176]
MVRCSGKKTKSCEFCGTDCTFAVVLWYNPFYSILQFCVTALPATLFG